MPRSVMLLAEIMEAQAARRADLAIAESLKGKLCEGCPRDGYADAGRCAECPRRQPKPISAYPTA